MQRLCSFVIAGVLAATCAGTALAQNASGTGQQATDLFTLPAGLATFELEHEGEGAFSVRLLDEQGELIDNLAAATGAFRGSKAVRVPRAGRYLYDVSATGPWSIHLRSRPEERPVAETRPAGRTEVVSDSLLRSRGSYYGAQEANRIGAFPYMLGGLLGGMVAGPIGAGAALAIAAGRDSPVPEQMQDTLATREPLYREAFVESFQHRLRTNRRTAALVGGVTGTAIFAFAIVQVINWSGGSGGTGGPGNGEQP
ncbi:hypothetical protein BH23GEM7_BH23GEM7_34140 [soil metagenome]